MLAGEIIGEKLRKPSAVGPGFIRVEKRHRPVERDVALARVDLQLGQREGEVLRAFPELGGRDAHIARPHSECRHHHRIARGIGKIGAREVSEHRRPGKIRFVRRLDFEAHRKSESRPARKNPP